MWQAERANSTPDSDANSYWTVRSFNVIVIDRVSWAAAADSQVQNSVSKMGEDCAQLVV